MNNTNKRGLAESGGLMLMMQPGKMLLMMKLMLVIHLVVGVFELDVTRHVAIIIGTDVFLLVAVMMVRRLLTDAGATAAVVPVMVMMMTAAVGPFVVVVAVLVRRMTVGRFFRAVLSVLLDSFVLRPPILEPNFNLKWSKSHFILTSLFL